MSPNVAVLSCIPLDEADWHQRAERRQCGDFVRFVSETRFNGKVGDAWSFFSAEAEFIKRKFDLFADRGTTIRLRATVDDIRSAAARHRDVVLIAHWKGETVLLSDIIYPAQLLKLMTQMSLNTSSLSNEPDARACLQESLNEFIFESREPLNTATMPRQDLVDRSIKRREFLNQIPFLEKGNRLEVWDAMLTTEELSLLFPKSFGGTAFMVVCTSDFLAETFRRHHPDAICICSRDPVSPGLSIAKLDAALLLMSSKGILMWQALQMAADIIDSIA